MSVQQRIKNYYVPKYSKWIFTFLFIFIFFLYNYHNILFKPPQSVHQWRQADCLSITLNYYQDNNLFHQPAIHNLGATGTGKTISEFPLIYFTVAQLWKIFGPQEFIYRLLVVLLFFAGLFALFKLFENMLKDSFLAVLLSLLMFTSPTLVYYANNFIMNVPSFSLALIGLFFFFRFEKTGENNYLFLMALFYALAGLLKITALLSFFAIAGLFVLELSGIKIQSGKKIFSKPQFQFIPFVLVIAIQAVWYWYAYQFNKQHNSGIFLIGTLPIWELTTGQIHATWEAIKIHIKTDYFRRPAQVVFVLMLIFTFLFYKHSRKVLLLLSALLVTGLVFFVLLFFPALKDHDYYIINMFIVIPVVMLSFFICFKNIFPTGYNSIYLKIILLIFFLYNLKFANKRIDEQYDENSWRNKYHVTHYQQFEKISPYLRSIGIKAGDKVFCISDRSINISLYLMNQKGWTGFGMPEQNFKPVHITNKIHKGAKYLLIYDKKIYKEKALQPYLKNKIGHFKNVEIYALCDSKKK